MDSVWMMSTTSGIMSVPESEVKSREGQGWKKCEANGAIKEVPKSVLKPVKKKDK